MEVLTGLVAQDPSQYKTKEEYEEQLEQDRVSKITNFIVDNTNVKNAVLENNILTLEDYKYNIKLEFINPGEGKLTLEENGLSELAIDTEFDPV